MSRRVHLMFVVFPDHVMLKVKGSSLCDTCLQILVVTYCSLMRVDVLWEASLDVWSVRIDVSKGCIWLGNLAVLDHVETIASYVCCVWRSYHVKREREQFLWYMSANPCGNILFSDACWCPLRSVFGRMKCYDRRLKMLHLAREIGGFGRCRIHRISCWLCNQILSCEK